MPIKLAILGLDPIQKDWIEALRALALEDRITIVAAAHRTQSLARDIADLFAVPAFDDLRELQLKTTPQLILLDRPDNVSIDFLTACVSQNICLFSLGPPVHNVAEAITLADHLEPRSPYLYVWPRFAATRAYAHCAQADEFVRPVKFASATWLAPNHTLAKSSGNHTDIVRSLSVLAWDAIATLISLIGMPESVYASLRGNPTRADAFTDLSGAASLTLRFADGISASLVLSDRIGPARRELLLLGQDAILRLDEQHYHFSKSTGELIDEGTLPAIPGQERNAGELRDCIAQLDSPPSPHRGQEHRLPAIAATMEAMVVSQKTGQPEAPERFLALRR
jgi:predicted dehydrogenase